MALNQQAEIEGNFQAFQDCVAGLMPQHAGEYALMRDRSVVQIYRTVVEAVSEGHARFQDERFSVQEVTDTPLDLGFFSHANPIR